MGSKGAILGLPYHARFTNEAKQRIQRGDDRAKHEQDAAKNGDEFTHA